MAWLLLYFISLAIASPVTDAETLYWNARNTPLEDNVSIESLEKARTLVTPLQDSDNRALFLWIAIQGELAQRKGKLFALSVIKPIYEATERLKERAPSYEHFAADRILGHLYLVAPAIISIGSKTEARKHLQAAYDGDSKYPGNGVGLAELLWEEGQTDRARALGQQILRSSEITLYPKEATRWRERLAKIVAPEKAG